MDYTAIAAAITEKEIPSFIAKLEKKYGKEFIVSNFGFLAVVREKDTGAGMFRAQGHASNANVLRIAHGAIRSLSKQYIDAAKSVGITLSPEDSCRKVMNILWAGISSDIGRDGVPSVFLEASVDAKAESDAA